DLAIALARQAWRARAPSTSPGSPRASSNGEDLRLVIMSATIDAAAVSAFLDDCPVVDVPGRLHPLVVSYAPGQAVADAVGETLGATDGPGLGFLSCAGESRPAIPEV